jgi:hypothetical protein
MQCKGRLSLKTELYFEDGPRVHKNKPLLFLIPKRCDNISETEICANCLVRKESTEKTLEKYIRKSVPNQVYLFHGIITEPIPDWSRLYKGIWFLRKLLNGYSISERAEKIAEESHIATHKDVMTHINISMPPRKKKIQVETVVPTVETVVPTVETVVPAVETVVPTVETVVPTVEAVVPTVETVVPTVETVVPTVEAEIIKPVEITSETIKPITQKRMKKKEIKSKSEPVPVPEPVPEPIAKEINVKSPPVKKVSKKKEIKSKSEAVPEPIAKEINVISPPVKKEVEQEPPTTKKFVLKKATTTKDNKLLKVIDQTTITPEEEIVIELNNIVIDGRKVLYNSKKDKVYDLKFNYIGRRKGDIIDSSFPDSDCEYNF